MKRILFAMLLYAGNLLAPPVLAQTFEPGMAAATCQSDAPYPTYLNDPSAMVVGIKDLRDPAGTGGVLGQHWNSAGSNSAPLLAEPEWIASNLGEVFGLAIGEGPNPVIFTSSTNAYQFHHVGPDGRHAIYKLRMGGGLANGSYELFHSFAGGHPGTSLGQIAYSAYHDTLYVSNFDDGMITTLHDNGNGTSPNVVDTFDHGVARTTAGLALIDDDPNTVDTALGRLIWGVQVNAAEQRLYYAVRNAANHQVWSAPITANGALDSAGLRLEFDMQPTVNNINLLISDIAFTRSGTYMVVSERGMRGSHPHSAGVAHYQKTGGTWSSVGNSLAGGFDNSGDIAGENSAGGVDFAHDYQPNASAIDPQSPEGRLLISSNYNIVPAFFAYGFESVAMADALSVVPNVGQRYIVDLNGVTTGVDKNQIGDVEALRIYPDVPPQPVQCMGKASLNDPQCAYDPDTGAQIGHTAQLDFTNNSPFGTTADALTITAPAGVTATLDPPFAPLAHGDGYSGLLAFSGATPETEICFTFKLGQKDDDGWCCPGEVICVTPPACTSDCVTLIAEKLRCEDDECQVAFENTSPVPIGSATVVSDTTGMTLPTIPTQLPAPVNPGDSFDFVIIRGPYDGPVTIKFNGVQIDDGPWVESCCEQTVILPDAKEPPKPRLQSGRDTHVLTLAFDRNGDGRADTDIVPPTQLAVPLEIAGSDIIVIARTGADGAVMLPSYIVDAQEPLRFRITDQGQKDLNIATGAAHLDNTDLFSADERLNPKIILMK